MVGETGRAHPALQGILEDGHLVLGVEPAPVHHQHAALPALAGAGQESLQLRARFVASEPVEIDVPLHGELAAPEPPQHVMIQAARRALDELVRVRDVEGGGAVHQRA